MITFSVGVAASGNRVNGKQRSHVCVCVYMSGGESGIDCCHNV